MKILPNNIEYISLKQLHERWKDNNEMNDWNNIWYITYIGSTTINNQEMYILVMGNKINGIQLKTTMNELMDISIDKLWSKLH